MTLSWLAVHLILREVLENKALRKISVPKNNKIHQQFRMLHGEQLCGSYHQDTETLEAIMGRAWGNTGTRNYYRILG
jgi:hypothetical protein